MNTKDPKRVALLVVALLVVAAIGVVVAAAQGADEPAAAFEIADAVEVSGDPLPPFSSPDTALGLTAPRVSTVTADGDPTTVGDVGRPTVIGFVAHWCPHCQRELPQLVDWVGDGLPEGVDVVVVSTAVDENAENHPPSAWFAREGWEQPVVIDDAQRTVAASFGLTGFPFWVALDADGAVVARAAGQINRATFDSMVTAAVG